MKDLNSKLSKLFLERIYQREEKAGRNCGKPCMRHYNLEPNNIR